MGFAAPPLDKRILKKRYVELAKKHHPDQSGPEASVDRMASVTEAYKTLQHLLEDGRRGVSSFNSRRSHTSGGGGGSSSDGGGNSRDDMRAEAASFVAPGATLSMAGWTLPWQRGPTTSARREKERHLREEATSLYNYVKQVRALEREDAAREARLKAEMKSSEGSHGFTAEHFEETRRMQQRDVPWRAQRESLLRLWWRYHRQRLSKAPRRWWNAARYVLLGH
ncbi:chaperone protein DNAJ [Trypanosoma grayi]|uniref:chaperone protein DNAJ n=1 Tax=Trypanosoma grayi TaxID=71804 RepID=UPI0004F4BC30|nr:chaperone protein DNAJ [Trypanosoma grayi]KEG10935.1 chaperone protein DNAJ [Trypanosoma grayi]